MKKVIIYTCLLFLIATISCDSKKSEDEKKTIEKNYKDHFRSLSKDYKYLSDVDKWELKEKVKNVKATYFRLEKNILDTVEILSFYYNPKETNLSLDTYLKKNKEGEFTYYLEMRKDTLFHYKIDTINKNIDFIVGKYAYMYKNDELESSEFDYYYLYSDSLNKVRGNDVLPLPQLSEEEKEQLKLKMQ